VIDEVVRHPTAKRIRLSVDPATGTARLVVPKRAALKSALAWAEANTLLPQGVSQQLFEEVREYFSEAQLANLTLAIATINAWNRFGVSFAPVPGSYQPG